MLEHGVAPHHRQTLRRGLSVVIEPIVAWRERADTRYSSASFRSTSRLCFLNPQITPDAPNIVLWHLPKQTPDGNTQNKHESREGEGGQRGHLSSTFCRQSVRYSFLQLNYCSPLQFLYCQRRTQFTEYSIHCAHETAIPMHFTLISVQ